MTNKIQRNDSIKKVVLAYMLDPELKEGILRKSNRAALAASAKPKAPKTPAEEQFRKIQ